MTQLVCLLEEPSAREMLMAVCQKILPKSCLPKFIIFEGKRDMDSQLQRKLRSWQAPDSLFLLMRDQDSGDCRLIKSELEDKVANAGKSANTVVRIACHELESFYLGDLAAVEKGLNLTNMSEQQNRRKFRDPDSLGNAAQELKKLTGGKYQKILGSRSIGPFLRLDGTNKSHSFNVLLSGIKKLIGKQQ